MSHLHSLGPRLEAPSASRRSASKDPLPAGRRDRGLTFALSLYLPALAKDRPRA